MVEAIRGPGCGSRGLSPAGFPQRSGERRAELPSPNARESAGPDPVLGTARWVPSSTDGEALAVHVHRPSDGAVRRALVLAPPIGREQVISYRTLRVLAIRAASQAGAVVLRPTWSGIGESTGPLPSEPASAWRADLLRLIAAAREAAPGAEVTVVGLRLGAAVAASVVDVPGGAERTVAWEPVSGRRFVREHRALRRMSLETAESPERIELPGLVLSPEQADSLKSLRLPADDVLQRRGDVRVVRAGEHQRAQAEGMYAVASRDARVPLGLVDEVIAAAMPAQGMRDVVAPDDDAGAPERRWPRHWDSPARSGLVGVRSEFVAVGEHLLPGVLARPVPGARSSRPEDEPADERPGHAAGLLLIAADAEPMDGPTGLWARMARDLAGQGMTVLRAERRGIGEAGDPSCLREPMPYTEEAVEDVNRSAAWLRRRVDGPVAASGLCSGAWMALRCAAELDLVILINNIAWSPEGGYYWRYYRDGAMQRLLGGRERLSRDPEGRRARLKERLKVMRAAVLRRAPLWLLEAAARTGQVQSVSQMFRDSSTMPPVDLHLGDGDRETFDMAGGLRQVSALRRRGFCLRVMFLGEADHALLADTSRQRAAAALRRSLGLPEPETGG